jgi:ribosome-associated protein
LVCKAASDKKAIDIVTIDMRKVPNISDYFIIASGTSTTQVNAIADNIIKVLRENKQKLRHSEGTREALWVLLDFGDVVAHIFYDQTRRFYDLERLWGDVPQKRFKEVTGKRAARKVSKKKRLKVNVKKKKPAKAKSRKK